MRNERGVLSILRVAKWPLSTREIALPNAVQRGLDGDPRIVSIMARRVAGVLRDSAMPGLVPAVEETGLWLQGEIAR